MSESIAELKNMPLWVGYKNNGNHNIFIDPNTGNEITIGDGSQFGTYEQALQAKEKFGLDGINLRINNDYIVIYMHNVYDDTHSLKQTVNEIIALTNSYTEYQLDENLDSNDICIICKAPMKYIHLNRIPYNENRTLLIRLWNECFTEITFRPYETEKVIKSDCNELIDVIIDKHFNCGLKWRSFGSHYKCDIDNGISLWCFSVQKGKYLPFVTKSSSGNTTWTTKTLELHEAKEQCIRWRDELANFNYDLDAWTKDWKDKQASPPEEKKNNR